MFKNILLCFDGGAMDAKLTELGIQLGSRLQSTLHGLTVQDQLSLDGPLMYDLSGALALVPQLNFLGETKKLLQERAQTILDNFTQACGKSSLPSTQHTALGIVHRVITEKAELNDLTLLGRRGLNYQFDKDFLGSTADRVVRHCGAPLLVVSEQVASKISNPLLAYDGSHAAKAALSTATKFCAALDLPLTILYVKAKGENSPEFWPEVQEALGAYKILFKCEETEGNPHQALPIYAKQHAHDLVIVGSRGRSGIVQFILGSTTQYALWSGAFHVLLHR